MMRSIWMGLGLAGTLSLCPLDSSAQEVEPTVVHAAKTVLHFTDAYLTGEVSRPQGVYIRGRSKARFRPWVPVRQSFLPELTRSVEAVQ